jgi:hypothetical protein
MWRIALFDHKIEFIYLFFIVYAINVKNEPCLSVPDGMLVVTTIFPARKDLGSKLVVKQIICTEHW